MFNPRHSGPSERLAEWRQIRKSNSASAKQIIEQFGNVEIQQRYLDFYTPDSWPNVFEIVQEGWFDQTGLTLVMLATLHHLGFVNTDDIQINVISNHITGVEGAVFVYQGHCYNFMPGEIVSEEYMQEHSTKYDSFIITKDKLFD